MPEKVLKDFGIEPEEFNELELLQCVSELKSENKPITNGIFAPLGIYKDDFTSIGGHDPLYYSTIKRRFGYIQ